MNQKNFEYLKDQLFMAGFGTELNDQLRQKMVEGLDKIRLDLPKNHGSDTTENTANLSKSNKTDNYFFNTIDVILQKGYDTPPISYQFKFKPLTYEDWEDKSIKKGNPTITLKEAYNLLSERSVSKEVDQKTKEWVVGTVKEGTQETGAKKKTLELNTYPYNAEEVDKVLGTYPFKSKLDPEKWQGFKSSIEKGNRQKDALVIDGKEVPIFTEYTAKYKSMNFYDSGMNRMYKEDLQQLLGKDSQLSPQRPRMYSETTESLNDSRTNSQKNIVHPTQSKVSEDTAVSISKSNTPLKQGDTILEKGNEKLVGVQEEKKGKKKVEDTTTRITVNKPKSRGKSV